MLPYVVRQGDTLHRIARRFSVNPQSLLAVNPNLTVGRRLRPGLVLHVPPQEHEVYCTRPGDTVIAVASLFHTTVRELLEANPDLDAQRMQPGQLVTIPPGGRERIVDGRAEYGPAELASDLDALLREYPFLERIAIGESVMGKPIDAVRLGEGERRIQINAAMHANEWITTALLAAFLEDAAKACSLGVKLDGRDMRRLFGRTTIWFVPLVNPDGVELVQDGLSAEHPHYGQLLEWNRHSHSFARWKANIRGVDLNDQFPAFWEEEVRRRDTDGPGPRDFPGTAPLSEPEAAALADFTREREFDMVIALHTQGQEIYWNYRGYEPPEAAGMARRLAGAAGYKAVKLQGSDAGFKDWFIFERRKPGFTVEVGWGVNPLPIEAFPELYDELRPLLLAALEL